MTEQIDAQEFLTMIQQNPDRFFSQNTVYWTCPPSPLGSATLSNFTVTMHDTIVEYQAPKTLGIFGGGWKADGHSYQITRDGSGSATGYFLPWNEDFGYSAVLGGQAEFFINAEMSGCAFGCVAGPNQTVKVAHHNIRGADGNTDHHAMTGTLSAYGYQHTFQRNDYRNLDNGRGAGNVVGVKVNGSWRIYAQGVYTAQRRDRIASFRRLM
ncbi:hypothetical protein F1643_07815 [Azospirillum sp. INR13]|uniref:hypothetical protein n=1 Tax=unclassified Azospirillum TaxID=2630922 RepID=UPI0011F051A4|nr:MULTISPECIES: hypothetical protein [unclassified Azospirillum]KAA0578874.1 hypothetical protein FZ983_16135 [Azospirillum sp. B21]MBF5094405.1 hypothetical protein [Azospirillum sp. INR13]